MNRSEVQSLVEDLALSITREMHATDIAALPQDPAYPLFHTWALRWRLMAERMGLAAAAKHRAMRRLHVIISRALHAYPAWLPLLFALKPDVQMDWTRELENARKALLQARTRAAAGGWMGELDQAALRLGMFPDADATKDKDVA